MSITDELRNLASVFRGMWVSHDGKNIISEWAYGYDNVERRILAIADRIDAEHKKAEDEWRAKNGCMWLKGYAACREELMEGHPVIAADLEKAGWVELPKDADDMPWNIGDRDEYGNEVIALKLTSDGWFVITDGKWPYRPEQRRHYHTPTVEDVMVEFATDWESAQDGEDKTAVLKEYAGKLRLAEGEDA